MAKKILILSGQDIQKLLNMEETVSIVESAFRAQALGRTQMPPKSYVRLEKFNGDFRAMPAYACIRGIGSCGIKWVSVYPRNKRYGLPAVMALIILNDPKNGLPLAIMDGTYITNMRTGAAGAVAAKYLANKDSSVVALVGCGAQGQTQIMALNEIFKIKTVFLYDSSLEQAKLFLRKTGCLGLKMIISQDLKECLHQADILVTVTPSRKPVIKSNWVKQGLHINAIGADAPGKQELEPAILRRAKVAVDELTQACHSGEINVPLSRGLFKKEDVYATLGEIISGQKRGRISKDEITVFDSTGLAILDVAIAGYVYRKTR